MAAGAGVAVVPGAHLLLAMGGADARIHVEYDAWWRDCGVLKLAALIRAAKRCAGWYERMRVNRDLVA